MTAFPRTLLPANTSIWQYPPALQSWGNSGKPQFRETGQRGRLWTEEWPPLLLSDQGVADFLATCGRLYRAGTIFTITTLDHLTPHGVGGGSPLVKGASQTGASLLVDAAPLSTTNWLKAGDIIKVAGVNWVLDVTANVTSDGSGNATIGIDPPILAGQSPADNAVVTITAVTLNAAIIAMSSPPPMAGPNAWLGGFQLTFRECP